MLEALRFRKSNDFELTRPDHVGTPDHQADYMLIYLAGYFLRENLMKSV